MLKKLLNKKKKMKRSIIIDIYVILYTMYKSLFRILNSNRENMTLLLLLLYNL